MSPRLGLSVALMPGLNSVASHKDNVGMAVVEETLSSRVENLLHGGGSSNFLIQPGLQCDFGCFS